MSNNNHINYIEFYANDLGKIKAFYNQVFGWSFTDYGPNYTSFESAGIDGGFEQTDEPIKKGVLVVLYHENLESVMQKIKEVGGSITKEIFSFPGGKRFQFDDPSGNELAVWHKVE